MKIPRRILERRRSVRIEESLPFKIGHENYETEAKTLNISDHGAMCEVERDIPIMTQLKVGLTLPASVSTRAKPQTIRAKGVVVRKAEDAANGKFYIAVYFSDISEKDQKTLQDYIDRRLKR